MSAHALASPPAADAGAGLTPSERERYDANYIALFGEVSETAHRRWSVADRHGRADLVRLIEELRIKAIHENSLGIKVQQLVHFGQLLALGRKPAAEHHAQAALKAGATVDELIGVVETAFITGGVPSYSLGIEIIAALEPGAAR